MPICDGNNPFKTIDYEIPWSRCGYGVQRCLDKLE